MLPETIIQDYAEQLHRAESQRKQIDALSMSQPEMDLQDAYRIQSAWVERKIAEGRRVIGKKIGLTSRAMQQAMNINEPDFGILLDDMVIANGGTIAAGDYTDPRLEVELAFQLKQDLHGSLQVADVLAATDYVVPALELIAARSHRKHPQTGYVRNVKDTIADNAANAGIICGDTHIDPKHTDLPWVSAVMYYNGEPEVTGVAAGVLGHPAKGICWLAERLAMHGLSLKAGEIVLAGSFTAPVACRPGDEFRVDFGAFGQIEVHIS